MTSSWLEIHRGAAPLIVSFPHGGTSIPADAEPEFASCWLARKDADWWIERVYDFAGALGATTIRTDVCRSVIDVNRDPSGRSLYPGLATTELCPTTTFDGEPLYRPGSSPDAEEIARRRTRWFEPYHDALQQEVKRLSGQHSRVVLYDAHSIRSSVPRLFEGRLPQFNIGSNGGLSCDQDLTSRVEAACDGALGGRVTNGRFKGGWITRRHGDPKSGVHAIQMELACRGYMDEPPDALSPENWPTTYAPARAAPIRDVLVRVLEACLAFAQA